MRIYKFRAWDKQEERMILHGDQELVLIPCLDSYGADKYYTHSRLDKEESIFDWSSADLIGGRYKLMQFTGQLDFESIEIYDYDICLAYKPNSYLDGKKYLLVMWNNAESAFRYFDINNNNWAGQYQKKLYNIGNNKSGSWCKVVGNMFGTPELMERRQ